MNRYLILLLLTFSCNSNPKENTTSLNKEDYNLSLPDFVKTSVSHRLPQWNFSPIPNQNIVKQTIDLNCDGAKDFVGVFEDSIGNYALLEIISFEEFYSASVLENYGAVDPSQIQFSLLLSGTTFKRPNVPVQVFDCGGVETSSLKAKAAKIYSRDSIGHSYVFEYAK